MLKYSIIVAVYNRVGEVKELLSSAEKLEGLDAEFEFLFVDDGSTDGFVSFIESYALTSPLNIRVLYQKNQGPGVARNTGMENSDAEYFIFVDSDCFFPKDWLIQIDRHIEATKCDAFGGADTFHPSFDPLLKAINYAMTSFLGTGGTRGNKKSVGKFYPRSFNMGIHRKVFENIGGMGTLRHGQDMDYSARIYEAGYKVSLVPNAKVYHKRRTSLYKFFKQIFNWGVARINLAKRHKDMLKMVHLLPAFALLGFVLVAGLALFAFISMVWLYALLLLVLGVAILAFVQSLMKYKQLSAALLSVPVLFIQIGAYGLGLIWGGWQYILGRDPKGFVKNYYGKEKKK